MRKAFLGFWFFYLGTSAWEDYQTQSLYRFWNYTGILSGIVHFYLFGEKEYLGILFWYILFCIFLEKAKWFGRGDTYLCIANSFYLLTLKNIREPFGILMLHMLIATLVFKLIYPKKEARPFVPSLAFTSWLFYFILE